MIPQSWLRAVFAAAVMVMVATGGWAINDRSSVETRLIAQERAISEIRLSHATAISEVRLTSERAISEVRISNQTTASQMIDILRRLDRMESKIDMLQR